MNRQINLPEDVQTILYTLDKAGFEAYAVGGCIRDSLLGREPNDWDITTSAQPIDVKKLFRKTIDTGIQHGTVTVMMNHIGYEVTTYRIDGEYVDGRHPESVEFTSSLEEDLKRRDFTINAMAYNEKDGLVDLFHGFSDMNQKNIRCVGIAEQRFTEDALRMMRAVRFSAQFGYDIEEETQRAIRKMAPNLLKVSAERIQAELIKLIVSPHPEMLRIAYENGLTQVFLPEFDHCMKTQQNNPHHCYSVGEHILHSMKQIRANKVFRLTMLFHDIGKPITKSTDSNNIDHFRKHATESALMAKDIMKRLKFDNDTMHRVYQMVKYHDWYIQANEKTMRRNIYKIGEELFPDIFEINEADVKAQNPSMQEEKLKKIEALRKFYEEIMEEKDCLSLKNLEVSGKDLIESGMKPGKEIGAILQKMLDEVLEDPTKNTKEYLMRNLEKYQQNVR